MMLRREFLRVAGGGAATCALLPPGRQRTSRSQSPARSRPRPNVIIVLTDDQGYGDLSGHGNPALRTPHLDKLRGDSVRLTNFHVAPMCTPTRSQLLTGHHALTNLAMNVSGGRALLRSDLATMAEIFADSGYATGLFGKWHLGDTYPYRPEDRGFAETVWFPSSHIGSAPDYWNNDYYNDTYRHNGRLQKYDGYCTDVFFGEALRWMRARHQAGQPFFTYLATNAPHTPLFVPEEFQRRYAGQPPEIARFFGMIGNIDDNMGRLETMLQETGLHRNTILVFLTDNGGTIGAPIHNAGMRGTKVTLWEGGHRVPCFLRWPDGGVSGGNDVGQLAQVQDLFPTLMDLCGNASSGVRTEGVSLAPLLRDATKALPDRMLIVQFSRMNVGRPQWGDGAVLWNQWRLVGGEALYDVSRDPEQTTNVIRQNRAIAARMIKHYDQWWAGVEPRLDSFLPTHIGAQQENPVLLSSAEWADVSLDQIREVRAGVRKNGTWHVQLERAGRYDFNLSRWPREAALGLRQPAPAHTGECGSYAAGVALPIAGAGLRAAGRFLTHKVQADDREVTFTVELPEGRATLQSFFYDDAGQELCGAYYVYARHRPPGSA